MRSFVVYDGEATAPVVIDVSYENKRAYSQIRRAAGDLRQDIAMVTGAADYGEISRTFADDSSMQALRLKDAERRRVPALLNEGQGIIIGAIGESGLIRDLMESGKLDEAKAIEGRWEAFAIKQIDDSIVIAGSDARGTIYGIYTLSEAIGVSPWYWFGDAAVEVR